MPSPQIAVTAPSGPQRRQDEMRTYDPADHILYVHLAQDLAAPVVSSTPAHDDCQRLSEGYANSSAGVRLGARPTHTRPALVVIPGGLAGTDRPASAAPELYLAE
jgi:hypothetical protein